MRARLFMGALLASTALAWHEPHVTITRAAIDSLPPALQRMLAGEAANIAEVYSFYPDRYRNAAPLEKAFMQRYCEVPAGRQIHNVTWDRAFDVQTVEYLFAGMVESLRGGDASAVARYAGTLAHLLQDSLSPAHAMDLQLLRELVPPPEPAKKLYVHAAMEISCPDFTLGDRAPQRAGANLPQAAQGVVASCYGRIRRIRGTVIELLQAVYRNDTTVMDRLRLAAAQSAAELYADALYSVLSIARDQGVAPPPVKALPPPPALDVRIGPVRDGGDARRAALNLAFGLREAVRLLEIDKRVQRTPLGSVGIRTSRQASVDILGDWPPHSGSQVTRISLGAGGAVTGVGTALDGALDQRAQASFREWIRTVDHRGDPLFELSVEPSLVTVKNHENAAVSLKPTGASFAAGLLLEPAAGKPLSIQVTEQEGMSQLRVAVSGRRPELIPISRE